MGLTLKIVFFLSGASALVFEILWFRLAGLTFGNSVWASAIVLSAFMGGLALGAGLAGIRGGLAGSPVRLYALLEVFIAFFGFSLVVVLPKLTQVLAPLFRLLVEYPTALNAVRSFAALGLMLLPATAMGATLPLLVKALTREDFNFGRVLGLLYGWNTLGAVAGVLSAEILLIRWLGLRGTGIFAAGLSLTAATVVLSLPVGRRNLAPQLVAALDRPSRQALTPAAMRILFSAFLSGLILLALEVLWFRFLHLFFDSYGLSFAVMLAVVLLGISLGGLGAARWFSANVEGAQSHLAVLLNVSAIGVVMLYANLGPVLDRVETAAPYWRLVMVSLYLILPVAFLSGMIYTMLGNALYRECGNETRAAGLLTLANTCGGAVGSLTAGLLLIPRCGVERSFFLLAVAYGLIPLLLAGTAARTTSGIGTRRWAVASAALILVLILFPFGIMEAAYLRRPVRDFQESYGERRVALKEGMTETIQYLRSDILGKPHHYRLVTNNHSMSATSAVARRYMKQYVYLPAALHSELQSALLIAFGCGSTAKALTDTASLRRIDIVDISRDIIEMSRVVYPDPAENPVHDPRVEVHIEDGRFFLLTSGRRYDLITAEPPPPRNAGVVNLYTEEYFRLIRKRLTEGGFVTYWLPVAEMYPREAKAILRGFCNVFPDCSLWTGAGLEWMMVGRNGGDRAVSVAEFSRQWGDSKVRPEMVALGFVAPETFGSFFVADGERLLRWIGDAPPLVDDRPYRLEPFIGSAGKDQIIEYEAFLDPRASRDNFLKSEFIARNWPDSLRVVTASSYRARDVIDDLLEPRRSSGLSKPLRLHFCLSFKEMKEFILLALDSDHRAQEFTRAVDPASLEGPAQRLLLYHHQAAGAVYGGDYRAAEEYYRLALEQLDLLGDRGQDRLGTLHAYTLYRMYLATRIGERAQAEEIGRRYLEKTGERLTPRRRDEFKTLARWLETEVPPYGAGLQP